MTAAACCSYQIDSKALTEDAITIAILEEAAE